MRMQRSLTLLLVVLGTLSVHRVAGQAFSPLLGQGTPPNATNVVLLEAVLDRLLNINSHEYRYQAAWYIYLSWYDPRAADILESAKQARIANGTSSSCAKPCSSLQSTYGCCDDLWLPSLELVNYYDVPQGRYVRWEIGMEEDTGKVFWWTRVQGEWFAPMDFRAYPLDHQHLILVFDVPPIGTNATTLKFTKVGHLKATAQGRGYDISGWIINWVRAKIYTSQNCREQPFDLPASMDGLDPANNYTIPDLDSNTPTYYSDDTLQPVQTIELSALMKSDCSDYLDTGVNRIITPVQYVVDVMVKRVHDYSLLQSIIPILLSSYLSFVVFFLDRNALETRIGTVITIFLANTALQFVMDFPSTSYLNAVQQLIITSYFLLFGVGFESLVVYFIVIWHRRQHAVSNYRVSKELLKEKVDAHLHDAHPSYSRRRASDVEDPAPMRRVGLSAYKPSMEPGTPSRAVDPAPIDAILDTVETEKLEAAALAAGAVDSAPASALHGRLAKTDSGMSTETTAPAHPVRRTRTGFSLFGSQKSLARKPIVIRTRTWWEHLREDRDYAQYVGYKIDKWCMIVFFTLFNLAVIIIFIVATLYGDHKLELGGHGTI